MTLFQRGGAAALASAALPADPAVAREFSDERIRSALAGVLSRPEFRRRGPSFTERFLEWVGGWLDRLGLHLPTIHFSGGSVNFVQLAVVVVAIVGFLCLIAFLSSLLTRRIRKERTLSADEIDSTLRPPSDYLKEADSLAAQGEFRAALQRAYLGTMLVLSAANWVEFRPSRTNWENLRTLSPGFPSDLAGALRRASRLFDRKWYGQESVDEEEYRRAADELARAREAREAAPV